MKTLFKAILIILSTVYFGSCTGGETKGNTDSAAPATTDTMPVVHPQSLDSSSIIKTPPVNDSNVIRPDSTVKNK